MVPVGSKTSKQTISRPETRLREIDHTCLGGLKAAQGQSRHFERIAARFALPQPPPEHVARCDSDFWQRRGCAKNLRCPFQGKRAVPGGSAILTAAASCRPTPPHRSAARPCPAHS